MTLLTCTGFRPQSFRQCVDYVNRFDLEGLSVEWIIVDDEPGSAGAVVFEHIRKGVEVLLLDGAGSVPRCSMPLNVHNAIGHVRGRALVFIEDDDWYAHDHVMKITKPIFAGDALAGYSDARYYHLPTSTYFERDTPGYASLCRTAVHFKHLDRLRDIAWQCATSNQVMIDLLLWGGTDSSLGKNLFDGEGSCVSIKGVPGRGSAGMLGRNRLRYVDNGNRLQLKSWIGEADYDAFVRRGFISA